MEENIGQKSKSDIGESNKKFFNYLNYKLQAIEIYTLPASIPIPRQCLDYEYVEIEHEIKKVLIYSLLDNLTYLYNPSHQKNHERFVKTIQKFGLSVDWHKICFPNLYNDIFSKKIEIQNSSEYIKQLDRQFKKSINEQKNKDLKCRFGEIAAKYIDLNQERLCDGILKTPIFIDKKIQIKDYYYINILYKGYRCSYIHEGRDKKFLSETFNYDDRFDEPFYFISNGTLSDIQFPIEFLISLTKEISFNLEKHFNENKIDIEKLAKYTLS